MDKSNVLIGIFIIFAIALIFLMIKMKSGFGPTNLKVYGLTLVIGMIGVLSLSEISTDLIAPSFGLLGAIAGYLFGINKN